MTGPLPTGTLTFLFTDIEGSTQRWEHQGDAMSAALVRHDEILRGAIEGRGGHVFKTVGDAFYGAFAEAPSALLAALEAQAALRSEDWRAFGAAFAEVRVRMGLHSGHAEARGGDYFGPALNRTARLASAGHGGQVLLSSTAREGMADHLPEGVGLRDLGEHRLKDLRHAEHIWQVTAPGLPDDTRSLSTAGELGPRERIVVADATASDAGDALEPTQAVRSVGETFEALHRVIRRDVATVVLTAAQVREAARHRPADLTEYRLGRVAEWSQPRYRLDGRFVALSLWVDRGEEVTDDRWAATPQRYEGLSQLLAAVPDPVLVVLGPPGSGKSTLLRHLELDTAIAALRGERAGDPITFFVALNQYTPETPGAAPPLPGVWLAARWAERFPALPPLDVLLGEGRVTLLLDALNEMPTADEREYWLRVGGWKDWLVRLARERPGNRVVFSCRSLDYSAPLSTPDLRVPQVRIEPLADDQVRAFLRAYSPVRGEDVWQAIAGTPQLDALRAPFFLALLVDQVEATGDLARDRAGLFTGFVRQALKREVENDNPLFALEALLSSRDVRRLAQWQWQNPYDLPERGALLPKLSELAFQMQVADAAGGAHQVRLNFDRALDLLDHADDERLVKAGVAIGVLDEEPAADEVLYRHQLLQEYFAARRLAREPQPERVRAPWRAAEIRPPLGDVVATLAPGDALPALPTTGWEETTILAAAMAADPEDYVRALIPVNLVVAGQSARVSTVRARLSESLLGDLRWALVARSRDIEADLRARLEAGQVLGWLGDPRFERAEGPHGAYLRPPMVDIPGGAYPIGHDPGEGDDPDGTARTRLPRQVVTLAPFAIGRFAVTNAEYACFMDAGGYEDDRWWASVDARAWRRGEGTAEVTKRGARFTLTLFRQHPEALEELHDTGQIDDAIYERFQRRLAMNEAELEAHLSDLYPGGRLTEPAQWRDERCNNPLQPVVGVCWHEARAFAAWLSAQTGEGYRLPRETEWEAAARGMTGRRFPYGETGEALRANTLATHLRRPSVVGVFPEGDTPEGVSDLEGSCSEWTTGLWGTDVGVAAVDGPHADHDEVLAREAGSEWLRVVRGSAWYARAAGAESSVRRGNFPDERGDYQGFRLVRVGQAEPS